MLLVIGSYSQAENPGIHLYKWDVSRKSFLPVAHISGVENPSYLTLAERQDAFYAITENKEDPAGWLHRYEIRNDGQTAIRTDSITFHGLGSCFVSTDAGNRHALYPTMVMEL